jgi:hypothetical protein
VQGTNTQAYYNFFENFNYKKFIASGPGKICQGEHTSIRGNGKKSFITTASEVSSGLNIYLTRYLGRLHGKSACQY